MVWLLCLALEAPYRRATGGVYVKYICTLRQMGVLLSLGGYLEIDRAHIVVELLRVDNVQEYILLLYFRNKIVLLPLVSVEIILPLLISFSALAHTNFKINVWLRYKNGNEK